MMKNKKWILTAGGFIILTGLFATYVYFETGISAKQFPVLGNPGHVVGSFALQDQKGDTITEKVLENKVTVVEFFYTTCTGICPRMNANMSKLYQHLKDTDGFQILSYTVHASYDKAPVLAKYSEQFDANPKIWKFLTGPQEEINNLATQGFLLSAADSSVSDQFIHSQWWALVDQHRRVRGFYDGLKPQDVKRLEKDIPELLAQD